jgi:3-phytase
MRLAAAASVGLFLWIGALPISTWKPAVTTESVTDDPDDPAIWIHPTDRSQSLIIGTNKVKAPNGALVVFDLNGKTLQTIRNLDRPNNVDLRQGVRLGTRALDIVATTERNKSALRFYEVDSTARRLKEMGSVRVFEGEQGERAAPMGIALYKRPSDGALFAMVGRKTGPAEGYLWQYRVEPGPKLRLARKFGKFSLQGEIEAIVVDDALGTVYYADEGIGIRKYAADPDAPNANHELALFGTKGYQGDREGLAIYTTGPETGYLISTDQLPNASRYLIYDRQQPQQAIAVIEGGANATDGIEATSTPLGPAFPHGVLVTMNSRPKNFLLFSWKPLSR